MRTKPNENLSIYSEEELGCKDCPADDSYWCSPCALVYAIENTDFDFSKVRTVSSIADIFKIDDS